MSNRVYLNNSLLSVPVGSLVVPAHPLTESPLLFSLVIPTYKESKNVETLVSKLCYLLDSVLRDRYELIIVDDDSPDRTWEIARDLIPQYPQLRVMRRTEERGLSTAVARGWQVAHGAVLGVIDADLQHPPEILLQLWAEIERGADLAVASRHVEEGGVSDWNIFRRILSRGAQVLGLTILPGVVGRVSDPMSGYFLVRREAIANKPLNPIGYKILLEVIGRGDIRCCREVGYVFQERQEGESKVTAQQYLEYIRHLLRLRFSLWPVERFLRFIAVGATGLIVDLIIFYWLRTELGLGLTRSALLSAEVAILNNFFWNDLWTYRDKSRLQKGGKKWLKRLLKFNAICLAGLILNVLLVNILYNLLQVNEYAAKLMAIAIVTFWNFWINLKLQWRTTEIG